MEWMEFLPLIALGAFVAFYALLYLAALICHVPELSAGKLGGAALVLALVLGIFDVYAIGSAASMGEAGFVLIPLILLANFLVVLFVARWLLRPSPEYGTGSAWGAGALCGLFVCTLLIAVPTAVNGLSTKMQYGKAHKERTQMLAGYDLPVPEGANFGSTAIETTAPQPWLGPPGSQPADWPHWSNRYSADRAAMFTLKDSPANLVEVICSGLPQAGYEVYRLPMQMICGTKDGVFVMYVVRPDASDPAVTEAQAMGLELNFASCDVKIFERYAAEMTALCREAAGSQ